MKSFKVVSVKEELNTDDKNGVYMVYKKNCLAQFSFGVGGTFNTSHDALTQAEKFVSGRKDKSSLRIAYIPRNYLD